MSAGVRIWAVSELHEFGPKIAIHELQQYGENPQDRAITRDSRHALESGASNTVMVAVKVVQTGFVERGSNSWDDRSSFLRGELQFADHGPCGR